MLFKMSSCVQQKNDVCSLTHVPLRCAINVPFSKCSLDSPTIASVSIGFFCTLCDCMRFGPMYFQNLKLDSEFRGITASFTYSIVATSYSELVIHQVIYFLRMA